MLELRRPSVGKFYAEVPIAAAAIVDRALSSAQPHFGTSPSRRPSPRSVGIGGTQRLLQLIAAVSRIPPRKADCAVPAANRAFATVLGIGFSTHSGAAKHSIWFVFHPPESPLFMSKNLLINFNFDQLGEAREYQPPAVRVI